MTINSFSEVRDRILSCLQHSISVNSHEAAWGVLKGNELSIVNTVEALLTHQALDALATPYLEAHKDKILAFLKGRVTTELSKPSITTRYISYGALGLHILGDNDLEDACIERLIKAANQDGGWAQGEGLGESLVVPTYHAMFALQHIGVSVDERHYDWLLSKQRSDSLLPFASSDPKTSFGPSALALYVLANSSYRDKAAVANLASAVKRHLPLIFEQMHEPNDNWAKQDSKTPFKIYAYGHGLAALNLLHENLSSLRLHEFLNVISISCNAEAKQISPAFSLDPTQTWIPAMFELSLALRSIRLNFDPFEYQNSQQAEKLAEVNAEIDAERNRLAEESRGIEIRQKVIDEWEKELLRQRRASYEFTRLKDEVTSNFTKVKDEVATAVVAELKPILPAMVTELKSTLGFYLRVLLFAVMSLGYILIRLTVANPQMSSKMDAIVTFAGLAWVIAEAIIKSRDRSRNLTPYIERANLDLAPLPRRDSAIGTQNIPSLNAPSELWHSRQEEPSDAQR
jgi:hypothetical protein